MGPYHLHIGKGWDEWQPETRNAKLHTYVRRQPYYCTGTFQEVPFKEPENQEEEAAPETASEQLERYRILRVKCESCGLYYGISRIALRYTGIPFEQMLPGPHPRPIPPYTQDIDLLWGLVRELLERGPEHILIRNIVKSMGLTYSSLVQLAGAYQILGDQWTAEKLSRVLWMAFVAIQERDWAHYDESQQFLLTAQMRRTDPYGVPYFARAGNPLEDITRWDLPYLLYPETTPPSFFYAQVLVSFKEQPGHFFLTVPPPVQEFHDLLAIEYQRVDPPRAMRMGPHWFWSISFQL